MSPLAGREDQNQVIALAGVRRSCADCSLQGIRNFRIGRTGQALRSDDNDRIVVRLNAKAFQGKLPGSAPGGVLC
jgi:hypothetical protein